MPGNDSVGRGAILSEDGEHRLLAERRCELSGLSLAYRRTAGWLMCNPSRADAEIDDPTVGRVMGHSLRYRCYRQLIGNMWTRRTPYPKDLWKSLKDRPPDALEWANNSTTLFMIGAQCDLLVVAFGAEPGRRYPDEVRAALDAFRLAVPDLPLMCLGTTGDGWPLHPLARGKHAIPADVKLTEWEWPK